MPTRLGIHIIGAPDNYVDWLRRLQPSVVKVKDHNSRDSLALLTAFVPHVVYRQYTDLTYHDPCEAFIAELDESLHKLHGMGLIWEGLNEPQINTEDEARQLNRWYVRFAELMHARGEKVAAYSFSTGNPVNLMLTPYLWPGLRASDYLALHEYYNRWSLWDQGARHTTWRKLVPPYYMRPILITEWGYDDGGDPNESGWRKHVSADEYAAILRRGVPLIQDTEGACLFTFGGGWDSFESWGVRDRILEIAG